jgi:hypothetical protein
MTAEELQAIRERVNKVTTAPWWRYEETMPEVINTVGEYNGRVISRRVAEVNKDYDDWEVNADFIAHAPKDVKCLLDEIETLERELHHLTNWNRRLLDENLRLRLLLEDVVRATENARQALDGDTA